MAGMFAHIVGSPYVFIEHFHVTTAHFGFFFGANALGPFKAQLNARLVRAFYQRPDHPKSSGGSGRFRRPAICRSLERHSAALRRGGFPFIYVASVGCLFPNVNAMALAPHGKGGQRVCSDRRRAVHAGRSQPPDRSREQRRRNAGCNVDRHLRCLRSHPI